MLDIHKIVVKDNDQDVNHDPQVVAIADRWDRIINKSTEE